MPPHIDSSDLDLNPKVIRSKSITLHCPVQGTPFPNITWLKNDQVLSENEAVSSENEAGRRLRARLSGRQLELSLAQQSDAAKYSCVAVNIAGKAAQHFNLQVLGQYTVPSYCLFTIIVVVVIIIIIILSNPRRSQDGFRGVQVHLPVLEYQANFLSLIAGCYSHYA